jgi:hypothetical protein
MKYIIHHGAIVDQIHEGGAILLVLCGSQWGLYQIDKILGLPKFQYFKNQVPHCLAIFEIS